MILDVTFDQMLTFKAHATATRTKLKSRKNVLKCLAGFWSKDKEVNATVCKATCRPILNYATTVWTSQLAQTHWIPSNMSKCPNENCHTVMYLYIFSALEQDKSLFPLIYRKS